MLWQDVTSIREKTSIEALESRIPLSLNQGNDLPQMPHRNAVESQAPKRTSFGRKSGIMNWIGIAA
jgi:hypothetical protein